MQVATYSDGRPLNYDEATHSFDVGGTPITSSDVMAYDDAGQLSWVSPETRTWARTYFAAPPVGIPQPATRTVDAVPVTPEPKRFPTWVVVVVVIAAVLVLGCCLAVAVSAILGVDQYTSESSTSTLTSSTVVPEPDVPSELPSSGLSEDEVAYAKSVSTITSEVAAGLGEIGRILTEDAKAVFSNGDVKKQLFEQIDIVKGGYDAVSELEAPDRLKPAHGDLLAAMKLFDESMDELSDGIEKVDARKVTHASELMIEGSKKMQDATAKLQDVRD